MLQECLIVGAGPTGLVLAIELRRFGIPVRLIDKASHPAQWSQALVVQARTLEQLDRYGLAEQAVAQGRTILTAHIWSHAKPIAALDFQRIRSRFPFLLFLPQNETEALLTAHLQSLGVSIERQVELLRFEPTDDDSVRATLRHRDGREEQTSVRWLVGCDGAHSTVRAAMGVAFRGHTSTLNFQLGDLRLAGSDVSPDALQVHLQPGGNVLALGRMRDNIYRVVLVLHPHQAADPRRTPGLADFNAAFQRSGLNIVAESALWLAPFSVNQRKAARYRQGNVLLAGDAAHIHSPVGGQGMNTGMQDAANLAWKLSAVANGAPASRLLDSYDEERGKVGEALLRGTAVGLSVATSSNPFLRPLRDFVLHHATNLRSVQNTIARTVSELSIHYRGSSMVQTQGVRGPLRAGDRMPDALCTQTGQTLLAAMRQPGHLLLALDIAVPASASMLRQTSTLVLQSSSTQWNPPLAQLLGPRPAFYLIRPDGYIGFVGTSPEALQTHAREVGLL